MPMFSMPAASASPEGPNYRKIPNNVREWWFMDPALRWNMLHCIGACGTMFFNGFDGSLFNGLQSLTEWEEYFDHPSSNTLGLMNSSGYLPGVIAGFFADYLNTYLGRRLVLWIGIIINMVGIAVMSTCTSVATFCAGRVILGFGISMALTIAPPLLQEIAHPRYRAQVGAFFTSVYYVAAILSASICLGCLNVTGEKSWRIPCWCQMLGAGLTLLMTCTIPESPRWLVKKGRLEEARAILVKYHANGKEDDELVGYEFKEIVKAIEEEENLPQTSYLDFFRSPGNRHRLMIMITVGFSLNWVGNGIISYYLSTILDSVGVTDSREQLLINLGIQIWNLIWATGAAVLIERIGRRPLWLTASAGMTISLALVMGLSAGFTEFGNKAAGLGVIAFLFTFYASYDIAYTPMSYSYPIEILTYTLRTKGSAIFVTIATLANAANQWVNPVALGAIHWKYYAVYIAIDASLFVIQYFGFPEVKDRTIEEIAQVFDGENAVARAIAGNGEEGLSPKPESARVGSIHEAHALDKQ